MARTAEIKSIMRKDGESTSAPNHSASHDIEFIDESSTDYLKRIFETEPAIVAALESGCTAEYMV